MFATPRKILTAALLAGSLGTGLALAGTGAQAAPRSHGHGMHHGGFGHHGFGHRGFGHRGWGYRHLVGYGYYGCYSRPRFDPWGNYIGRVRICR